MGRVSAPGRLGEDLMPTGAVSAGGAWVVYGVTTQSRSC